MRACRLGILRRRFNAVTQSGRVLSLQPQNARSGSGSNEASLGATLGWIRDVLKRSDRR